MSWVASAVVFLLAGILGILLGRMWQRGRLANLQRWHRKRRLPFFVRNLGFAMYPFGVCSLLLFLMFPIALIDQIWAEYLGLAVWALAVLAFITGFLFMLRPPLWLTPEGPDSADRD